MAFNDRFAKIEQLITNGRQIFDRIAAELIILRSEVPRPQRQAVTFQQPQANGPNATPAQTPAQQQQQPQVRQNHVQQQPPAAAPRQEQPNPPRSTTATTEQNATTQRQLRVIRLGATPIDNPNPPHLAPAAPPTANQRQPAGQPQAVSGPAPNATQNANPPQPAAKNPPKKKTNPGIRGRILAPVHLLKLHQQLAQREQQNHQRQRIAAEHGRYSYEATERAHSEARNGRGRSPARQTTDRRRSPTPVGHRGRGRTPARNTAERERQQSPIRRPNRRTPPRESAERERTANTNDRRAGKERTPARENAEGKKSPAPQDRSRGRTPAGEQPTSSKAANRRADDPPTTNGKKPKSREFIDSSADASRTPSPHGQQTATPEAANDPTVRKYTRKRAAPPARRPTQPPPPPPTAPQPNQNANSEASLSPEPPARHSPPRVEAAVVEYDPAHPGGVFANEPVDLAADTYLSDETDSESEDEPGKDKSASEQEDEDDELED